MRRPFLLAAAALAAGLAAGAAQAEIRTEPETQAGYGAALQREARRTPPARIARTRLQAFQAPKTEGQRPGVPAKVGHGRVVAELETIRSTGQSLEWEATDGGGLKAALSITSPGAAATRLGVRIDAAPANATFRFYRPSGEAPYVVPYAEIEAQLRGGATAAQANAIYWSPVVEGDTQILEVELPAGHKAAEVKLAVPHMSHLVTSAADEFAVAAKAAAACHQDVMCSLGTWATESSAVARMVFTDGGSTYVCSGTLVADRDTTTTIPYFLTAHHCVPSQSAASTLQTYWFYRASGCNSGVRGNFQTRTGGATLLFSSPNTDTAFMRLNSTPPEGAGYVGWVVGSTLPLNTAVTGIHHPTGDSQKISFGSVRAYRTCSMSVDEAFNCVQASPTASTFYSVTWTSGITETGSSGSGLFLDAGRYLVGQLYGGTGSCSTTMIDYYGRFDVAYAAGLHQWLGAGSAPASPAVTPAYDYSDLWWNPAESGWGMSLTQHAKALFAAWYVYDSGGNPTWVVMPAGTWITSTTYTGDLFAAVGQDPRGSFDPTRVTRTRVGSATLTFSARDQGVLTYSVNGVSGTKSIARQPFGAVNATPISNYADMWWNANESGWGLSISQQYRTLFAVWYAYRQDGAPVWYVVPDGTWTSSDTYSGTVYRTMALPRAFYGASFDPSAVTRVAVGSLTLRFSGTTAATMTYTIDGISGTKALTRQPF